MIGQTTCSMVMSSPSAEGSVDDGGDTLEVDESE